MLVSYMPLGPENSDLPSSLGVCALDETSIGASVYSPLAVDSGLVVNRYLWELQDQCFYKPANPAVIRR